MCIHVGVTVEKLTLNITHFSIVLLHVSDYSIVCADQTSLLITYLDVVTMTNGSEVSKYLLSIPILIFDW